MKRIIEKFAELEHKQWMSWVEYVLTNYIRDLPDGLIKKWQSSMIEYKDLSQNQKDKDRVWARKVLILFEEWKKQVYEEIKKTIDEWFDERALSQNEGYRVIGLIDKEELKKRIINFRIFEKW
ncbi:MAG TPA: hypothetical protein VMZ91_13395 [Candidatus Paceibacterota bacterium]|nr:hypothetical protein [Candidatus Paceibacterota bacterium]